MMKLKSITMKRLYRKSYDARLGLVLKCKASVLTVPNLFLSKTFLLHVAEDKKESEDYFHSWKLLKFNCL